MSLDVTLLDGRDFSELTEKESETLFKIGLFCDKLGIRKIEDDNDRINFIIRYSVYKRLSTGSSSRERMETDEDFLKIAKQLKMVCAEFNTVPLRYKRWLDSIMRENVVKIREQAEMTVQMLGG